MRKLWILAVAALLTVALAAPSFAAETTITGSYRIRSMMEWNWDKADTHTVVIPNTWNPALVGGTSPPLPPAGYFDNVEKVFPTSTHPLYTGYFDQRFRINITHKRSEYLKAVVSIDIVEDMWGQQRNFRTEEFNPEAPSNGMINTAYIEAITKIGLFKVGVDTQGGRFGMGTWSDSGEGAGTKGNPGITWGIKIDNFIATLSYVKYVDFVDTVFANKAGYPSNALNAFPGRPSGIDQIGGPGSTLYNRDLDTYVLTAHYITDSIKAGFLFQVIRDPSAAGAAFLVNGIADEGTFVGETDFSTNYLLSSTPVGPGAVLFTAWPTPFNGSIAGPGGSNIFFGLPGVNNGFGRAGMYSSWLYVAAIYADLKFLDNKLELKGEYDRIWGTGDRTARGDAYNAFLSGPWAFTTVPANYRLPSDIKIDGHTVYADLSYDFDIAKVGVAFLYGSGEKHWRAFTQHHYNFNTTGNDDFHWSNIVVNGNDEFLGEAYGAPLGCGSSPENVTSVKLYWSVDPMEKLNIHGNFLWAKYTQPVGRYAGGITTGTQPFYGHPMNYLELQSGTEYVPVKASDDLGWEIDVGATYDIMEGLSLNSEFGVLFTGDAFDYNTGGPAYGLGAYHAHDFGPIYRWVNTLTYSF